MVMAFSIDRRASLLNLFPDTFIRQRAKSTGAVKRMRNVDPVHLFWTLVLGFGVERGHSLAALRRRCVHQRLCRREMMAA